MTGKTLGFSSIFLDRWQLGEDMTFLIRESSNRARQDHSISVYSDGQVRHAPIYRDGPDFMLMASTFTSLMELVDHYTRKALFDNKILRKPAIPYADFVERRLNSRSQGNNAFKPLNNTIELKIRTLRASSFVVFVSIVDERKANEGIFSEREREQWRSVGRRRSVHLHRRREHADHRLSVEIQFVGRMGSVLG